MREMENVSAPSINAGNALAAGFRVGAPAVSGARKMPAHGLMSPGGARTLGA
jgi:hypothetical protein